MHRIEMSLARQMAPFLDCVRRRRTRRLLKVRPGSKPLRWQYSGEQSVALENQMIAHAAQVGRDQEIDNPLTVTVKDRCRVSDWPIVEAVLGSSNT